MCYSANCLVSIVPCCPTVPITLRLLVREELFHRGPFHLGRWSKPIAAVAFCWAVLACVLFILPQVLPVTAEVGSCWARGGTEGPQGGTEGTTQFFLYKQSYIGVAHVFSLTCNTLFSSAAQMYYMSAGCVSASGDCMVCCVRWV